MAGRGGVKRAIAIEGRVHRVLLLAWAADDTPRLHNIVGTDAAGEIVWRADLPGVAARDCFIQIERAGLSLRARTFTGLDVLLDPLTGTHVIDQAIAA